MFFLESVSGRTQTNTRPDICFSLSQYLVEPKRVHLDDAKHVMRYLKGTLDFGLCYNRDHDFRLYGYTNSDCAGSVSDRKSTSGCCFSLGSARLHGRVGSNPVLLLARQKQNILQHVLLVVKPYGFICC
jgi:hypothetical protein